MTMIGDLRKVNRAALEDEAAQGGAARARGASGGRGGALPAGFTPVENGHGVNEGMRPVIPS